jgi:flagellar biosynthetic protein FlhB
MAENFQEKTEQPTEKRLDEARRKGQVPQSKELPSCFIILFSAIFLYFSMSHGFQEMLKIYNTYVRNANLEIDSSNVQAILSFGAYQWLKIMAPFFGLLVLLTLVGGLLQTRFLWSFEALQFKLENLDPISGIKKLFTKRSLVEVLKALAKIFVLSYICYTIIIGELPLILSLCEKGSPDIAQYLAGIAFTLAVKVGVIFFFVAGLDFLFQRWQHRKELMMTHQEVKEEYKEREGDPLVKSRIRSLQREMSRRRMIEDVKSADVVVTNPTTFAVALKYAPGEMQAPQVVAKGAGFVAARIKEVAREHGVPLVENRPLAQGLFYGVKIGSYIPEKFYIVVAELLAEVFRRKNKVAL